MEKCGMLKHSEILTVFKIAKLSQQVFPEIEPNFVELYGEVIMKSWTILNNQSVHHEVIFNERVHHPLIISGWPSLEDYYNLPTEVVVTFGYYGNNNFGINGFKEVVNGGDLPKFHSRYRFCEGIYAFQVTLTPNNVDRPRLKLPVDFAEILRDYGYEDLILCGDNGKPKMMQLFHVGDTQKTKLGYEWDEFCKENNFKAGDTIQFRFDVTSLNKICYVYKFMYG